MQLAESSTRAEQVSTTPSSWHGLGEVEAPIWPANVSQKPDDDLRSSGQKEEVMESIKARSTLSISGFVSLAVRDF